MVGRKDFVFIYNQCSVSSAEFKSPEWSRFVRDNYGKPSEETDKIVRGYFDDGIICIYQGIHAMVDLRNLSADALIKIIKMYQNLYATDSVTIYNGVDVSCRGTVWKPYDKVFTLSLQGGYHEED